jgi:hypothetical protein
MNISRRFAGLVVAGALLLGCGSEPTQTTTDTTSGGGGGSGGSGGMGGVASGGGGAVTSSSAGGATTSTSSSSGMGPEIGLAGTYEETAGSIALGPHDVYWASLTVFGDGTNEAGIKRAPKEPGEAEYEIKGPWAQAIAVDATHLYWADGSSLQKKPLGSDGTVTLAPAAVQAGSTIALDETSVYWANTMPGTVMKAAKDGSGELQIAGGQTSPMRVAVDETRVYWLNQADPGQVMSAPKDGGEALVIADGQAFPATLAVDATHVYWTTNGNGFWMRRAPKGGGPAEDLSGGQLASSLALDATHAYWIRAEGVHRAPLAGGSWEAMTNPMTGCYEIALDESFAYWTRIAVTNGPKVLKVPK